MAGKEITLPTPLVSIGEDEIHFTLQIASLRNIIIFQCGFFLVFPMEENGRVSLAYVKNYSNKETIAPLFFPLLQPEVNFSEGF